MLMYLIYFWTPTSRQCWYCLEKWHVDHCRRVKGLLIIGYENNEIFWEIVCFFPFIKKKMTTCTVNKRLFSTFAQSDLICIILLTFSTFLCVLYLFWEFVFWSWKIWAKHLPIKMQNNRYFSFTFYGCDYSICTFLFLLTISPLN